MTKVTFSTAFQSQEQTMKEDILHWKLENTDLGLATNLLYALGKTFCNQSHKMGPSKSGFTETILVRISTRAEDC